jgi:hypothetical protein
MIHVYLVHIDDAEAKRRGYTDPKVLARGESFSMDIEGTPVALHGPMVIFGHRDVDVDDGSTTLFISTEPQMG